jgi:acyl carrier protein
VPIGSEVKRSTAVAGNASGRHVRLAPVSRAEDRPNNDGLNHWGSPLKLILLEKSLKPDILEQVRTITADVLSVPPAAVTPESSPQTLETWDSVHHLNLVLALEEKFSIQFSPEEIEAMQDVEKIASVIESKSSAGKPR